MIVQVPHDERRESLVEIRVGRGKEARLVTSIELLSPANKTSGEQGQELYLRKRRELLESRVNLVEIDVSLLPEDPPIAVALQPILDRCYDAGPYRWELDHTGPLPGPAFDATEEAWVRHCLSSTHPPR